MLISNITKFQTIVTTKLYDWKITANKLYHSSITREHTDWEVGVTKPLALHACFHVESLNALPYYYLSLWLQLTVANHQELGLNICLARKPMSDSGLMTCRCRWVIIVNGGQWKPNLCTCGDKIYINITYLCSRRGRRGEWLVEVASLIKYWDIFRNKSDYCYRFVWTFTIQQFLKYDYI